MFDILRKAIYNEYNPIKGLDYAERGIFMKTTGIVRKVDELGRIVLPIELRRTLDIEERDSLEIYLDGDKIILSKYMPACLFCGNAQNVIYFHGKLICHDCLDQLKKQF